jgi:uncharacterized membrane protein
VSQTLENREQDIHIFLVGINKQLHRFSFGSLIGIMPWYAYHRKPFVNLEIDRHQIVVTRTTLLF